MTSINAGSYLLLIELTENHTIQFGKHRRLFGKGYYVYVGSAMRNLRQRISRHWMYGEGEYHKHWHVDSILDSGEVLASVAFPSDVRREEELSLMVSRFGRAIPNFGASDCKRTRSNLYSLVDLRDFYSIVRKALEFHWEENESRCASLS
ncbi:MAG TPA: GIY-YIG nuclease family protein [Thermotogota bacterium]|nr:GIY-YIG nuclease family protein [Thermotogota bacterium]HRW92438.1 GIY-YIG nuclease family protein [Thermotogota bacterium]